MAIERPARGGGPEKNKGGNTGTSKSKIEKRTLDDFIKALNGNGQKLLQSGHIPKLLIEELPLRIPDNLETEQQWLDFLNRLSIKRVCEYLGEATPESIDVTQSLVLRKIANSMLRATRKSPDGFNEWLEFFSGMTPEETEQFIDEHPMLDNEAQAAGKRWLQIRENPALIDKIVNSRLQSSKQEEIGDIMEAAKSGDDLALYEALRNNIAWKIQDGAGARDTTPLIKQLNEVTAHLNTIYRERGMVGDQQDNIRKMLINARARQRRPKQQAIKRISDMEDDDFELESM